MTLRYVMDRTNDILDDVRHRRISMVTARRLMAELLLDSLEETTEEHIDQCKLSLGK